MLMKKQEPDYTFLWSNNQLLSTLEMNLLSFKRLKENTWNQVENIIEVSRNNKILCYHSKADLKRDRERGKNFLKKKYSKLFIKELEKACKDHLNFFRKLKNTNFLELTNKDLFSLTREMYDRWETTITFFRGTQEEGTHYLIEELKKSFNDDKIYILISPVKLDIANKERIDWQKLVQKSYSKKRLIKHAEKYPWVVPCHNTVEVVVETLKQRYEFDKNRNIVINFEKEKKELAKQQNKIIKKDFKLKPIVALLQRLALSRMEVKSCWAGTDFYTIPLFKEIAKRCNENINDLRNLYLLDDIKQILSKGKKLSKQEKQRRKKCFVGLWKENKLIFKSGDEAEKLAEKELKRLYKTELKNEVKGTIANSGIAKGIAKVLESNNISQTRGLRKSFKKGDILITQMTQPNVIDIVSKASAIVTDEGGMLSHAAIISREFKIPCIVGTHFATQSFKDGDLVEVDADKGIVRKINK